MKPAFPQHNNYHASNETEMFLHHGVENFWEELEADIPEEKQFNSIKYLLLTAMVVLLIAFTVFISNRNPVSEQQEAEPSHLISFFKK